MNIIKSKNLVWVDIKNPNEKDLGWLKNNFNLHPLILNELLPTIDYPRIENFNDYLFIVLFYPFFDKTTYQMIPFELDIIVSKNYIITSHYKDIVPLKAIFDQCNLYDDKRKEYFQQGPGYLLYRIIEQIFKASFPKLSNIKKNIDEIEDAIFRARYKETVKKISLIERDLIGFERIIEPQELVLKNLSKTAKSFFSKKTVPYLNDLINIFDQVKSILQTRHKTLLALNSTNESLLTNRTNEIIKLLTIFSVIVFPLTLIAAIFGMNTVYLPLVGQANDFWIIAGIMLIGTAFMLTFFKLKKWI